MGKNFDILVVGAGPAGLAAGIAASGPDRRVCVVEKNAAPGRKLRLSGSGQCNLTHGGPIEAFLDRYGDRRKSRFVKPALFAFDNLETIRFFRDHGVALRERSDGKVFPESLQSGDVLRGLIGELEKRGGLLLTDAPVRDVEKNAGGFSVRTDRETIRCGKLILATGGCSYPATGSTGDGFRFARHLGHRIEAPRPALTPVEIEDYSFASCSGISLPDAEFEIVRNGKRLRRGRGDVLFTHRGLSGPGLLDASRHIEAGDTVRLVLRPNPENASDLFFGKKTLKNAPSGLPERLFLCLLESLEISPDLSASEVRREERKRLESALGGFPLRVRRLGGWNEAMVTAGGVALEEVDRRTMQSRIVPGLYFCGETLDIDGDTGGYNIQFAFSSGKLAGAENGERRVENGERKSKTRVV